MKNEVCRKLSYFENKEWHLEFDDLILVFFPTRQKKPVVIFDDISVNSVA